METEKSTSIGTGNGTGTAISTHTRTCTVTMPLLPDARLTTTIYINQNDLKRLELIANSQEMSVSFLMRKIIKHYLMCDGQIDLLDAVDDQLRKGVDYRAYL